MEARLSVALDKWHTWFKANTSSEVLALHHYSRILLSFDHLLTLPSLSAMEAETQQRRGQTVWQSKTKLSAKLGRSWTAPQPEQSRHGQLAYARYGSRSWSSTPVSLSGFTMCFRPMHPIGTLATAVSESYKLSGRAGHYALAMLH